MVRTKVFVGNLSFKTREPGLVAAFEPAGKVVGAQLVSRANGRSLGYGFVEFESEDGANNAINDLNKQLLDEREINVELAKPRQEGAPAQPRRGNFRGGFRPRGGNFNNQGGYGRPYSGGRGGNFRGGFRPRGRGGFGRGGLRNNRLPKKPIEERNLQPSSTSLFVTNLPFKYTDTEFGTIFNEAGVKPKSVKVATRFNGRSRGYGFVEFENNADQQKALAAVDKKTVEGRELVVKIAMFEPTPPPQQGQSTPAPVQQGQFTPKPAQPAQQPAQPPAQQPPQQLAKEVPKQEAKPVQPAQQPAKEVPKQEAKPAQPAPAKEAPKQEAPKQETKPAQPAPAKEAPKQETPKPAAKDPAKGSPQQQPKKK